MKGNDVTTDMISVKEFCRMSDLGKTTTFKLLRTRRLASIKLDGRRLISLESAQALIAPDIEGEAE